MSKLLRGATAAALAENRRDGVVIEELWELWPLIIALRHTADPDTHRKHTLTCTLGLVSYFSHFSTEVCRVCVLGVRICVLCFYVFWIIWFGKCALMHTLILCADGCTHACALFLHMFVDLKTERYF